MWGAGLATATIGSTCTASRVCFAIDNAYISEAVEALGGGWVTGAQSALVRVQGLQPGMSVDELFYLFVTLLVLARWRVVLIHQKKSIRMP
jgi:hypothetical protein